MAQLGLWRLPRHEPADLTKIVAHVCQTHHMTPAQVGDLTMMELAMYTIPTTEDEGDFGTTLARLQALDKLTFAQRVELQRLMYS